MVVVLIGLSSACTPSIGDDCEAGADCPDDAICDVTVEGGYCTVPNCEPGGCPEDSLCVIFDRDTSFCMAVCERDDECRDDHVCRMDNNFEDEPIGYCFVPQATPGDS